MTPERAQKVAELRRHLQEVAPARSIRRVLPTGIPGLDERIDGFPSPGLSVVSGPVGSGRLGLVLPALQALTQQDRTVAVVDVRGWIHPPGFPGVAFHRFLLVRPGPERALWATEQLARSGAVALVLVVDLPTQKRAGRRLLSASEGGATPVIVVQEERDRDLPASLCLEMLPPAQGKGVGELGVGAIAVTRHPSGRTWSPFTP